jgi:hypothetical protein
MSFLKAAILPILVTGSTVAFYAICETKPKMVDTSGVPAYMSGPSVDDVLRCMGDDPNSIYDPADDPELKPYAAKRSDELVGSRVAHSVQ